MRGLWFFTLDRVSISALSDRGLLPPPEEQVVIVAQVSISALSDRGLLPGFGSLNFLTPTCFNIRSFGSWIASLLANSGRPRLPSFNIRSFGSWIASITGDRLDKR